jgi:hypothetical protein
VSTTREIEEQHQMNLLCLMAAIITAGRAACPEAVEYSITSTEHAFELQSEVEQELAAREEDGKIMLRRKGPQ